MPACRRTKKLRLAEVEPPATQQTGNPNNSGFWQACRRYFFAIPGNGLKTGLAHNKKATSPTAIKPSVEGSGTVTRVGENTGLADPGLFCPKVLGPVALT